MATSIVADLLANLGPTSASSQLIAAGLKLTFDGAAKITVPGVAVDPALAKWIAEGAPIPMVEVPIGAGVTLEPRKVATMFELVTRWHIPRMPKRS